MTGLRFVMEGNLYQNELVGDVKMVFEMNYDYERA